MQSVFDKTTMILLARIHGILDAQIAQDSPGALKVQIRKLEAGIEEVESSLAQATGAVTTAKRTYTPLKAKWDATMNRIKIMANDDDPTNDQAGQSLLFNLNTQVKPQLDAAQTVLDSSTATEASLREVLSKLNHAHERMTGQLARLEALDTATKAKEQAAASVKAAQQMVGTGSNIDVDNIVEKMQRRADQADASLDQQMGKLTNATSMSQSDMDLAKADAAAQWAELKQNKPVPA